MDPIDDYMYFPLVLTTYEIYEKYFLRKNQKKKF